MYLSPLTRPNMGILKNTLFSPAALALTATLLAHISLLLPQLALCAVIPDGTYLIQMADSDNVVFFSSAEAPPRVTLKKHSTSAAWRFEHLGNDYFKITEQKQYLALDSYRSEKYNGVPIITFPWHGGKNQRWKVLAKGAYYSLINQETGLALDLKNNEQNVGGVFQGYKANGSRGQLFRLTPASGAAARREQKSPHGDDQIKSFSNGSAAQ